MSNISIPYWHITEIFIKYVFLKSVLFLLNKIFKSDHSFALKDIILCKNWVYKQQVIPKKF